MMLHHWNTTLTLTPNAIMVCWQLVDQTVRELPANGQTLFTQKIIHVYEVAGLHTLFGTGSCDKRGVCLQGT